MAVEPSHYRLNKDLFSNYYLDEHLPETEAWNEIDESELRTVRDEILELWEGQKETAPKRNESQLEEKFIRPMFRKLGIPFEVEETVQSDQRRPDYGFFESEADANDAFKRKDEGGDFYKNAVAVADAKRWGRSLDTRGETKEDYTNPSFQIDQYLRKTETQWGVLTTGEKWRLYYKPTSHKIDSFYEVDLPKILEDGDLQDFKYFYLFFGHQAFLPEPSGDTFLDDVQSESNVFARELGEDLQDNIYEAIKLLAEGFLTYPKNDLDESDLNLIHDSSLIYLYRLIFVLYAEAEGRDLLDTDNEYYQERYSLNSLKQEIADELESGDPKYPDWDNQLWFQINQLFELIDQGSQAQNIPRDDLFIPAYNGGLFRTDTDETDSPEAQFLQENKLTDAYLARVIDLLTRSTNGSEDEKIFVDYSTLDVRHLGSIYEGLLEYQLNVADEPLTLNEGGYTPAENDDEVFVQEDELYLTTDSGQRKATGSFYTPEFVVEYIVENTLGPLVEEIREDLVAQDAFTEGGFADEFANRIFDLKIVDPALGSGHFLTNVVDFLAREIIDAQEKQLLQEDDTEALEKQEDIYWARRQVAQRCVYGIDLNPLAVELSKVSLWLRTLAAEQPLAFLDHHLKTGNSLVGSDIEHVLQDGSSQESGQLTLRQSFDRTRRQALEHITDRFQDLLSIDNETLADIKEMEDVYQEASNDPLYQKLISMANVHTAQQFGMSVPKNAYSLMAEALRDDSWSAITEHDWYDESQTLAKEERYFHWELEFPIAFYEQDGTRKEDGGFDVVLGNPPYIPTEQLPKSHRSYLTSEFEEVLHRKYDSSVAFLQQSFRLANNRNGHVGMITPVVWETGENYERFRKHNFVNGTIGLKKIVNLPFDVFEDAYIDTTIAIFRPGQTVGSFSAKEFEKRKKLTGDDLLNIKYTEIPVNYLSEDPGYKIYFDKEYYELLKRFNQDEFTRLGELTDACQGIVASFYEYSHEKESDEYLPYRECDVYRYECTTTEEKYIDFSDEDSLWKYYTQPRILVRRLVNRDDRLMATYVEDNFVAKKDLNPFISTTSHYSLKYILAILNSTLHSYIYIQSSALATKDDFRQTTLAELRALPIRQITSDTGNEEKQKRVNEFLASYDQYLTSDSNLPEIPNDHETRHDCICELVDSIIDLKKERGKFNLSLLDHLGNYGEGEKLPDVGIFQPSKANILDETKEDRANLRIGDVQINREGTDVSILATARYKPEVEEEHNTDQWGYTETSYYKAFSLANLDEYQADLIEAFVPVAVDKGGGFSGFRGEATKTKSLIDRLKDLTLPDTDDVKDDLERYIQIREQAHQLDVKIANTDTLIDEIVYELYELTDEEIATVESTFD